MRRLCALLLAVLTLCGCSDSNTQKPKSDDRTQALELEVAELKTLVSDLDRRMQALSNEVWFLNKFKLAADESLLNEVTKEVTNLGLKMDYARRTEVRLTSDDKGYSRIDTDTGSFFISFEDAQPFLEGYKVRLKIGNPSSVTYNGFKLNVKWGRAEPQLKIPKTSEDDHLVAEWEKSHAEWQKSLHSESLNFFDVLKPGEWNRVEVVLSPAKSDELAYLVMSMQTEMLLLLLPTSDR